MSKESLARAMTTDTLEWSDRATMPVEMVAAMSGATNLGSDLFRARDYDPQAIRRAILLLASKALKAGRKERLFLSRDMANLMATGVIFERLAFQCRGCFGSAVVVVDQLKIICPTCNGIGVHRYTDKDRSKLCGVPVGDWPKWERRHRMVMDIAVQHDIASMLAHERLG